MKKEVKVVIISLLLVLLICSISSAIETFIIYTYNVQGASLLVYPKDTTTKLTGTPKTALSYDLSMTYPNSPPSSYYDTYHYKEGFIPLIGTLDESGPVYINTKTNCFTKSTITGPSTGLVGQKITITATTSSTVSEIFDPFLSSYPSFIPTELVEYYKADTEFKLYTNTVVVDTEPKGITNNPSENGVSLEWTPTQEGTYSIKVTTKVIDSQCYSSKDPQDSLNTLSIIISPITGSCSGGNNCNSDLTKCPNGDPDCMCSAYSGADICTASETCPTTCKQLADNNPDTTCCSCQCTPTQTVCTSGTTRTGNCTVDSNGCAYHETCVSGQWNSVCVKNNPGCGSTTSCVDGTVFGACSTTKPKYCLSNGTLINKCSICTCPTGYTCGSDEACSESQINLEATCAKDSKCKLGCTSGDEDCTCVQQNGIKCSSGYACPISTASLKNSEGTECCLTDCKEYCKIDGATMQCSPDDNGCARYKACVGHTWGPCQRVDPDCTEGDTCVDGTVSGYCSTINQGMFCKENGELIEEDACKELANETDVYLTYYPGSSNIIDKISKLTAIIQFDEKTLVVLLLMIGTALLVFFYTESTRKKALRIFQPKKEVATDQTRPVRANDLMLSVIENLGGDERKVAEKLLEYEGTTAEVLRDKLAMAKQKIDSILSKLEARQIIKQRREYNDKLFFNDWLK